MKTRKFLALLLMLAMIIGMMQTMILAYEEEEESCPHTNVTYIDHEEIAPTCFEPGSCGYWYCDDCYRFLDKNKENGYWEEIMASKIPALGHSYNSDTGRCDNCTFIKTAQRKISVANLCYDNIHILFVNILK